MVTKPKEKLARQKRLPTVPTKELKGFVELLGSIKIAAGKLGMSPAGVKAILKKDTMSLLVANAVIGALDNMQDKAQTLILRVPQSKQEGINAFLKAYGITAAYVPEKLGG